MPIAILLIVGLVFYSSTNQEKIDIQKNETTKVVTNPTPTSKPVKEEIKAEPVKEEIKAEPVQELAEKELIVDDSDTNYLKIILYIIAAIGTIFGGFYLFSNRKSGSAESSSLDVSRKDIEESYHPETQEQQSAQEETQTESQEQQPAQEETQNETQEQQPAQEETQTESQEQQTTEDENKNK